MTKYLLTLIFLCMCLIVNAQSTVTGKVTDAGSGEGLPGVSVFIEGTTIGTVTDVDGNYQLQASSTNIINFSFVGFATVQELVGNRTTINVVMEADITQLGEIVVTAFGLEKSKKSLGYAATTLDGKELVEARDVGIASQLSGRIAGVQVNRPTTGPAGSTNILIRGIGNLSGENRPLIVIDGVPVDNTNLGTGDQFGGRDTGDGFTSINQDDIEDINIIKGPAAATLFGDRGANGAIIITTKKGYSVEGVGIQYNGNYVFEDALILPEFQQQYGNGASGLRPATFDEARDNAGSWGERFDGALTPFFDGVERPYSAAGDDDLRNYYERGHSISNTLSLVAGSEKANARVSLSNLQNSAIVPNSDYERTSINVLLTANPTDKITVEAKANYIREDALNRPNLSDNPSNPGKSFTSIPANISVDMLRNAIRDENGDAINWSNNPFALNPFWGPFENINEDTRNRWIGYIRASYDFTDWLTLQLRYGLDTYNHRFFNIEREGTPHNVNGTIFEDTYEIREENRDFLLMINKDLTEDINLNVNLGGIQTIRRNERFELRGSNIVIPGLDNVINTLEQVSRITLLRTETNALFGNAQIAYKGFLFLDGAVRQDWYSTLTDPNNPDDSDNSAIYGSGALSFVFSDIVPLPSFFSFGKLRAAYGSAGNGAPDPFTTALTFNIEGQSFQGVNGPVAQGFVGGNRVPNPNLEPTRTRSFEIGADLRFLDDRLALDFTYYIQSSINQIFFPSIPFSSGFESAVVNGGDVENRGIEVLLTGTPLKINDFSWDVSLNFTRNRNEVKELTEGIDVLGGAAARFSANIESNVGDQVGNIVGTSLLRNDNGEIIHGEDGLPQLADERTILGNFAPDWYGGITNTFYYKNLSFSFLIDVKQGGEVFSLTNASALGNGKHKRTLEGRENPLFEIQGRGVGPDGVTPNQTFARLDEYYGRISEAASESIFDASYVKMRQMSIGYTLPESLLSRLPFTNVRFSVVGRNLFFLKNGLDEIGVDPEGLYNIGINGFEFGSLPSTRSYGFNLSFSL